MDNKIRVIVVEPEGAPKVAYIDNTLKAAQNIVGGYIEYLPLSDDGVCLMCNEEGKLNNLPLNRQVIMPRFRDTIVGTFYITKSNDEGDNISLTEDEATKWCEKFKELAVIIQND